MAKSLKNVLGNGKNNVTALSNLLGKVQSIANKTSATNTNTVNNPNLPTITRPTTINLKKAQQPVQTKLNNLNIQAQPQGVISNNPAFNNGALVSQNNPSRFIGFQNNVNNLPSTDLGGNIIQANVDRKQQEKEKKQQQAIENLKNRPVLNIPSKKNEIEQFNKKQSETYRTNENVIKDFHYDVQSSNGTLTKEWITQHYPEFAGKEDIALMLQADILPLVQNNEFADMKKLSEIYPELLPKQKKVGDKILKDQEKQANEIKERSKKAEKTLSRYNTLSKNGEKYLEDARQVGEFVKSIRRNYNLPGNPSDMDILNFGKENIPELKQILDDMEQLKSNFNLTEEDRNVIFKNGFDLGDWLLQAGADIQNFTQNNQLGDWLDKKSSTWEKQLSNLGLNGGTANTVANLPSKALDTAEIPVNMVGSLASGVGKFDTALERITKQQNRNEDGTTDTNGIVKDVIKGGGGALEIGFNTVMAIPTALFHLANETEAGKSATDQIFGTVQEKLDNIQSGKSTNTNNKFNQWYNGLDDETKADLLNEEMVALFSAIHKGGGKVGGKVKKLGEFEINSAKNAINEALQERFNIESSSATFKAKVEKGLADGTMKVSDDGMLTDAQGNNIGKVKVTKEKLSGTDKVKYVVNKVIADNRIAWNKGELNADVNMNALPDNRGFRDRAGEKAYNAGVKTREVYDNIESGINKVKEGANNVVQGVQNINVGNAVKGTAEAVGKGVKATSDLYNKGKNAVTQGKNAVTNAVKENVVEPFKKGYEGVKETVNENIVEPYNKGRGKTNQLNTETGMQGTQQLKSNPTSVTDNKINGDNYTQKNTNSKPLNKVQLQLLQNNNRMNPKTADTFKERYGEDYGQFLADRGFTKSSEDNLKDLVTYKKDLLENKNELLNTVEGTFKDQAINDMIDHIVDYVVDTVDRKNEKRFKTLQEKANNEGLTMSEINDMRQWYSYHVKTGFFKEQNAKGLQKATNIYDNLKDFLDKIGEERGLTSLREINKEIMKTQHIIGGVSYKMNAQGANNLFGLTDYILGATITDPGTLAIFLAKQMAKQPTVKNAILNATVGRRGNAKNRITKESKQGEKENIKKINEEKRQQAEQEKRVEAGRQLQSDLSKSDTKALPNKGGTDGGKNILTNGKTIITDAKGNSKVKGQISEIDNRKPTDTTPPTENTPTEKVEKTAPKKKSESKPKNKVTSKKSEVTEKKTEVKEEKKAEQPKEEKQLETRVENKQPEPKGQAVDSDNIKTYGSDYVLDNMYGQKGITNKSGKKVKTVQLHGSEWEDIDIDKLTTPPEGVDFMDYQIDKGSKHIIVDKDGNVYKVLNGSLDMDFDSFFNGIIKRGESGLDADIVERLEGHNQYMKSQGWGFKDDYNKLLENKNKILNGEAKEGWKKTNKDFVEFIEGKNKPTKNVVTEKAGVTTKSAVDTGKIKRQELTSRHKEFNRVAKFTNTILDVIESNGGLKDGYLKVEKSGFEPLYIEEIGGGKIAIGQTYIQEGDVMFDPEIVFGVDENGRLQAETIRNDSMGIYEQPIKPNDPFLDTWEVNLREFIKSVDKKENTNIIGKNNSLTTKNSTNGGKDLGTAESGLNQGVGGASESRDLQRTDGLSGTERDNSGGISGDLHKEQGNNDLIVDGKSAGPAIGQGQGKLLTRGEARAINQSSKDILEKHKFSTDPKDYTAEEIETLRQYEGAGGLTNKGEDTKGVLDQFYTPQTAIDAVWDLVDKYKNGKDTYTVLEPTVGTGRFIRDRANEQYEGHEIDKTPGTIAQILHPEAKISVGDFEDQFMDFTGRRPQEYQGGKKDIVVGNPPYSQRITPQQKNGLEPKIKRSEEFFIKKGIDVLEDGGILAMVVPSTFLSNPMTYAKEQIFDNATLVDAYRLPEGVFPYTQVGTDIVVFKKSKSLFKRENNLSDNKRFEQHPEKVLGEVKERINRFGKLEKYVDGGGHPLDKLNAIYEDKKTIPETKKEQAENYSPVETREETPIKQKTTTEIIGEKNKVTAKTTANKKPTTKKGVKIENQTLIRGDKTDIGDSVFGKGELDNKLLEYSKKTDINGYVEGPVGELVENDPKNLNYYKAHAVINDLYFAGDIYEKLEQLERDKTHISEAQYKKQKEGLQAVMPEPYTIENHPFLSPLDQNVMEFETNELGNVYDSTAHDYVDKKLPIKDVFLERFRKNVSSSTVNKNLAREYINGEAMRSTSGGYGLSDEEKAAKARHEKSVVMEQVNEIFNDWLWNKLDKDVQQKILDKFNRENRSYVVPKYENMALATRGISKTFNGKPFKPQPGQVEGINFLLSKGAGIVAHGVGHGKTIEGVVATREAQLRGWNKRPLIVAPGPTLYAQWVRTIKELYPEWEIVNLGGLTKSDIKRLKEELGDDPRNWVKDGQVAILSMQGFGDHIEFKPGTQRELEAKLHDVMETKDLNVRQSESLDKKITQMLAPGKGASSDKYVYSEKGDFLRTMYSYLVASEKSDFIDYFTEHTKQEYPELSDEVIKADAEAMWNEKPVFLEDLGIDHITVDEMHNFKNVFTSAKMQEDENGKKDVNRYGQIIKGTSSARGQKMYLATQYILDRNNNRNVFGLTATPFNNQPIEMYNMLSFVGRNELEKMGLTNINDFFSRFAEFREGLAPKASGTELEYKFIMKDFANARDLQRTITQFINYKGDSEDLIKPEKKLKVPVLKMSELQKQRQSELEYMALAKENQGDVLKATNGMISNLVSPFIVAGTRAPTGWKDFLDNSPKLKYFADVLKELRAEGKQDGMFIYMPVGQEFHELYAEALSEYAGVPREKIGIIDSKTSAKKDEIAEKFRSGEVNVLIGGKNTAEGIDLQNNGYITAITSVGWNPTERVQVDGRVWRQGNFNNEVLSVVPLIENSADVIFMGKADQKGSRINNALEQMLFGGEGDLSADEMMMSLMTEPEKKARTQINIQSQEIDKEIYGLNSQKDRLQELKRRINDAQKDPEEIQKQIDNEKQAGRSWRLPSLKDELKTATKAKEWIDAYKENNGELPSIEDIDNQTLEIEKQVDELRATQSELKNNEDILNTMIEEIKQKQADDAKGVKSYQDYIDDIKSDFKNAKRFGSKEELKEYLDNKKNNVLANDKNKITSGKTMASRASRPSIRMNVEDWEKKNVTDTPKNKVTSGKNYNIPQENKTKIGQAITKMRNNAESGGVKVARYTKNGPLENALNTIYNINSIKRKIRGQDHYNNVLNGKEEGLLSIAEILDGGYKDENISYKRFYDPLDEKHPTIIFWKGDNIDGATKTWALHSNKNDNTNPSIDKFRDRRGRLEVTPLRKRKRGKKK